MEIYNSEQEQVEALKAWWDKNGNKVLAAIVVVLAGVFGWKSWQGQQQQVAENAATAYQIMADKMVSDPAAANEDGRALVGEYPNTIYAAMATMAMARLAVEADDLDAAAAHLRAAMEQTKQPELKLLARLRLSRVLLAQQKADEALAQLNGVDAGSLQASFDEQRGDILVSQGKLDAARDAYTNALSGYGDVRDKSGQVQIKLNDLAKSDNE